LQVGTGPGQSWRNAFPATLQGVIDAAAWLEAVAAEGQFPDELSFNIQLCVEELFTNVVRHGGGQWEKQVAETASPVNMSIEVARTQREVSVELEDNGTPFDVVAAPAKVMEGDLEDAQPGGLGIKLIKEFCSSLSYSHAEGLNRTSLKFLWPRASLSLQ
jgi:serine/threonine-protein kinase RsbW